MRIIILFITICFVSASLKAQSFFEDFSEGIPSSFNVYDEDGNTLNESMFSLGFSPDKSWISYSRKDVQGNFAASTSKYEESGTSNDWLVTPAIKVSSGQEYLEWKAASCSKTSFAGYKVLISTKGSGVRDFIEAPVFEIAAEEYAWNIHRVALDKYKGQTIYVAFVNHSTDKFLLGIDDIKVYVPGRVKQFESATVKATKGEANFAVAGIISANFVQPITAFTATYVCGDKEVTQTFAGLNIKPDEQYTFTFTEKLSPVLGDTVHYSISVNVEGEIHTTDAYAVCYSFATQRKHIIEEATGTWCGFCPSGLVAMEYMREHYPDDFIGIAVHNEDPMTVKIYDNGIYSLGIGGYPTGFINRKYKSDPMGSDMTPGNGGFETWFLKARDEVAPAELDFTAEYTDEKQEEIRCRLKAKFALNLPQANYNVAFVIKECNVRGTNIKYNQTNYYAGGSKVVGGFEKLPGSVPASVMVYHDVARSIKPYFKGDTFVNKSIVAGEEVNFEYVMPVPTTVMNKSNITFIALLLDPVTGEIVNARDIRLNTHEHDEIASSVKEEKYDDIPNISMSARNGRCDVSISMFEETTVAAVLYDISGSVILNRAAERMQNGIITLNTAGLKGNYLLKLTVGGVPFVRKVIL